MISTAMARSPRRISTWSRRNYLAHTPPPNPRRGGRIAPARGSTPDRHSGVAQPDLTPTPAVLSPASEPRGAPPLPRLPRSLSRSPWWGTLPHPRASPRRRCRRHRRRAALAARPTTPCCPAGPRSLAQLGGGQPGPGGAGRGHWGASERCRPRWPWRLIPIFSVLLLRQAAGPVAWTPRGAGTIGSGKEVYDHANPTQAVRSVSPGVVWRRLVGRAQSVAVLRAA